MNYAVSEISARSPEMSNDEFVQFVADIKKNGQLIPIWIRGTEVIDGRKRLAACKQLGIKPKIVNLDPEQDSEQIARALNVLRTHYTPSQRAIYATDRARAQEGRPAKLGINTEFAPTTVRQAGAEVGVSQSYVSKAREVVREGAPEVVAAVKEGKLTVHAAREITQQVPKDAQAETVAKVIEGSRGKLRHTPTALVLNGGEDVRKHRAQPAKPDEQFRRSISMLEVAVDVLMTNAPLVKRDFKRTQWLETLSDSRTTITHIIKALEN